jgi:hypothetical protein
MFCQGAYVWFGEEDGSQLRSTKFHQHIVVSCRIKPDRDVSGLVGVDEEYAPQQEHQGTNSGLMGWTRAARFGSAECWRFLAAIAM